MTITFSSPLEALFWGLCCFHEIPVERNAAYLSEGPGQGYAPGFRVTVPKLLDVYVEVADGVENAQRRDGRAAWRSCVTQPLLVLYPEDLRDLLAADRATQFAARLRAKSRW